MQPVITVVCFFTRLEMIGRWFDDLASTDLDPTRTNLCFIVDCNEPKIYAFIMEEMNKTKFRKFLIHRNYEHVVNEVNIPIRRQRIVELHEQSKELVRQCDGEYILGLEDDTVFTNLCVGRLLDKAQGDQVGLVSAYEAGRWHAKIIGVWKFDDALEPKECRTMLPDRGFESVDAAGFYCYVTRTQFYLDHDYSTENWQPWGPDVNFGLWLRKMGYKNYVDWSQPCGHADGDMVISPNGELVSERFIKTPRGWERLR